MLLAERVDGAARQLSGLLGGPVAGGHRERDRRVEVGGDARIELQLLRAEVVGVVRTEDDDGVVAFGDAVVALHDGGERSLSVDPHVVIRHAVGLVVLFVHDGLMDEGGQDLVGGITGLDEWPENPDRLHFARERVDDAKSDH